MMPDRRATNRAMFWRIIRGLFGANRGCLFVMLLALGAGAAVTAALLNLRVDAKLRLTTEFRAVGANLIIAPKSRGTSPVANTLLNQSLLRNLPSEFRGHSVISVPFLYVIAELSPTDAGMPSSVPVVVSGTELEKVPQIFPTWDFGSFAIPERKDTFVHTSHAPLPCLLVTKLASRLRLVPFEAFELKNVTRNVSCRAANI